MVDLGFESKQERKNDGELPEARRNSLRRENRDQAENPSSETQKQPQAPGQLNESDALTGVREALQEVRTNEAQSDKIAASLTPEARGAILNDDNEALKKLGFNKLTTENGSTARKLTDLLNSLENRN